MVITVVWFSDAVTVSAVAMEGGSLTPLTLTPNDSVAVLPFASPSIVSVADPYLLSLKSSIKLFADIDPLSRSVLLFDAIVFVISSPS